MKQLTTFHIVILNKNSRIKIKITEQKQQQRLGPTNIFWSSRRLEDFFKTCLEEVLNTSSA